MSRRRPATGYLLACGLLLASSTSWLPEQSSRADVQEASLSAPRAGPRIATNDVRSHWAFEENRGQSAENVEFVARCDGYRAFLHLGGGATLALADGSTMQLRCVLDDGVTSSVRGRASARAPGVTNYLIGGRSPVLGIPSFRSVRYELAAGVEAEYRVVERRTELLIHLPAGVHPSRAALEFSPAIDWTIELDGRLRARTPGGAVELSTPRAYQGNGSALRELSARYVLDAPSRRVAVAVPDADPRRPLTIDPVIAFGTYLGAGGTESWTTGMDADSQGRIVVTGRTQSADFPVTGGAYSTEKMGTGSNSWRPDVFVTKFQADGGGLLFSTFVGGTLDDTSADLAVGPDDDVYVCGQTASTDFPVLHPTSHPQQTPGAFVTRLHSSGSRLVSSTYLSGGLPRGVAPDSRGRAHVIQSSKGVWVHRLSEKGDVVEWSAKLPVTGTGGSPGYPDQWSIVLDPFGSAYIGGQTHGPGGNRRGWVDSTSGAFQETYGGGSNDGFVAKIDVDGDYEWISFLGGSDNDSVFDVAVDRTGRVWVSGGTTSTDLQVTADAQQAASGGGWDAFVARVSGDGATLEYLSYLGGRYGETSAWVDVHEAGFVAVSGPTRSDDFPTLDPVQASNAGGTDFFVTLLRESGQIVWSTYAGGRFEDIPQSVLLDRDAAVHVYGGTSSDDWATTPGAYTPTPPGGGDAVLLRIEGPHQPGSGDPLELAGPPIPATIDRAYDALVPTQGGTGPFTFTQVAGALPQGMVLEDTGRLAGTPTELGSFPFSVYVYGSRGVAIEETALVVNELPSLTGSTLPDWSQSAALDVPLDVFGGTPPFTAVRNSGSLPVGVSLTGTARVTGTPQVSGDFAMNVTVTDRWGAPATGDLSLHVNPAVAIETIAVLEGATHGLPYTVGLASFGGTGSHEWSIAEGLAPTLAGLGSDGWFSGDARPPGTYVFTAEVEDTVGGRASREFSVLVNPPPRILADPLPIAAVQRPYAVALSVERGTPPFVWADGGAGLPAGLDIGSVTGLLEGRPQTAGVTSVRFTATDLRGAQALVVLDVPVAGGASFDARGRASEEVEVGGAEPKPVLRYLELVAGTELTVKVKLLGKGELPYDFELLDAAERPLAIAPFVKLTRKVTLLRGFPVASTGRYYVRLVPVADSAGNLHLDVRTKVPKRVGGEALLGAEPVTLRFGALAGTRLAIDVRAAKGSPAQPTLVSVTDADGNDLLASGDRKDKPSRVALRTVVVTGGDIEVVLAAGEGGVLWKVAAKPPKGYTFAMPEVPAGSADE